MARERVLALSLVLPVLLGALLTSVAPRLAAQGLDLYSAEAPVAGESIEERGAAMRSAFGRVLVKLTGRRDAATRYESLLDQGVGLVQEYRYRLAPSQSPGEGEGSNPLPDRSLWVRFDAAAVEQLLASRQVSTWAGPRPAVLLWLGVEQNGRRELSNLELQAGALAALRQGAEARGVAVQLPLLDLEDQTALSAADLWTDNDAAIRAASQRYGAATVLGAQLVRLKGDRWQARWTLLDRDNTRLSFIGAPAALDAVLVEGLDLSVDQLVAMSVPAAGADSAARLRLRFLGVQSLADYADLIALIGRQEAISRLAMRRADGDTLVMDVWLRGDARTLEDGLRLDGRLSPALGYPAPTTYDQAGNPVAVEAEADLVYRWSP